MRARFVVALLGILGVLGGCASAPPMGSEVPGIRVLTFGLEWQVNIGGAAGAPEPRPALFGGDFEGFPKPLRESVAGLWAAFPGLVQDATGKGPWIEPARTGDSDFYKTISEEEMDRNTPIFPAPLSRGYLWPEGFRFVDPTTVDMAQVASAYPGEWFLIVQYRAFVENAGDDSDYKKADFKMGLVARFRLYSPLGTLWSDDTLIGYSKDKAARLGVRIDRQQYPRLLVQAQEDVVKQWSRRPQFKTGG